jgi:hypothetical protein
MQGAPYAKRRRLGPDRPNLRCRNRLGFVTFAAPIFFHITRFFFGG